MFLVFKSIRLKWTGMRPKWKKVKFTATHHNWRNTCLLEKHPNLCFFFFAKTCWISMKRAYMRRLWTFVRMRELFPPVNSVRWWQAAFEWGSLMQVRFIEVHQSLKTQIRSDTFLIEGYILFFKCLELCWED